MPSVKLREAPFSIDADKIAEGLLEMFDDNELAALRFGMLPYEKMQTVERCIRERFLQSAKQPCALEEFVKAHPGMTIDWDGDRYIAVCDNSQARAFVEFSMKKLVAEAMHLVSLALYDRGNLVV